MSFSVGTVHGGATRFLVTLENPSILDAIHTPVLPDGTDGILTTTVHITFALQYTADQGDEIASGAPAGTSCITQSKVEYTRFETGNIIVSAFENDIKTAIQRSFDDSVIGVYRTVSSTSPSRCARWRPMP